MAKKFLVTFNWLLVALMVVVLMSGQVWAGKYTIDDVMTEVQGLQLAVGKLEERINFMDWKVNFLMLAIFAIFGSIVYLAREVKIPKEERIAELEKKAEEVSKLKEMVERMRETLYAVTEKLHLPKPILLLLLVLSAYCLLPTISTWAEVPKYINIQGRVTDKTTGGPLPNKPIDIYDENNNKLGSAQTNEKGIFNAHLAISDPSIFTSKSISIFVGKDVVGSLPLDSVPYAFRAAVAESLPGVTVKDGKVGIGTTAPTATLEVAGDVLLNRAASRIKLSPDSINSIQASRWAFGQWLSSELFLNPEGGNVNIKRIQGKTFAFGQWLPSDLFLNLEGGNVGIGTTSPTRTLEVNGIVKATKFEGDGSGLTGISGANLDLLPITLDKVGGKVGIGTTNPSATLEVAGDVLLGKKTTKLGVTTGDQIKLNLSDRSIQAQAFSSLPTPGWNPASLLLNPNGGNVGIGTTEPGAKLDVRGTEKWGGYFEVKNQTFGVGLGVKVDGGGSNSVGLNIDNSSGFGVKSSASKDFFMGKVGIGESNPEAKLHVSGRETTLHGKDAAIEITNTASGGRNWYLRVGAGGTQTPAGGFSIADDAAYRMVITKDGNVGIGTTTPTAALTIQKGWQVINIGTGENTSGYSLDIGLNDDGVNFKTNSAIRSFNFSTAPGALNQNFYILRAFRNIGSTASLGVGLGGKWPNETVYTAAPGGVIQGLSYGVEPTPTNLIINPYGGDVYMPNVQGDSGGSQVYITSNGKLYKSSSSRRYKENIQKLEDDFSKILKVEPKSFTWKSSGAKDIGLIAEDLDEMGLKNLVIYNNEGQPESVKYEKVSLYLLEVIKELKAQNDNLKAKNEELEARVRALESGGGSRGE